MIRQPVRLLSECLMADRDHRPRVFARPSASRVPVEKAGESKLVAPLALVEHVARPRKLSSQAMNSFHGLPRYQRRNIGSS